MCKNRIKEVKMELLKDNTQTEDTKEGKETEQMKK